MRLYPTTIPSPPLVAPPPSPSSSNGQRRHDELLYSPSLSSSQRLRQANHVKKDPNGSSNSNSIISSPNNIVHHHDNNNRSVSFQIDTTSCISSNSVRSGGKQQQQQPTSFQQKQKQQRPRQQQQQKQQLSEEDWDEKKQDDVDVESSSWNQPGWATAVDDRGVSSRGNNASSSPNPASLSGSGRSQHRQLQLQQQQLQPRRRRSRGDDQPQQRQRHTHQRGPSSSSSAMNSNAMIHLNTSSTTVGSTSCTSSSSVSVANNTTTGNSSHGSNSNSNSNRSNKEDAWRKPGRSFRARLILHDEKQKGTGQQNGNGKKKNNRLIALSKDCPIEKYYRVADKVLDQFLQHPIDTRQDMLEAYLLGTRLCKFLSATLPTHPDYFVGADSGDSSGGGASLTAEEAASNPTTTASPPRTDVAILTAARNRSQEQLMDLLQYVEELALIVDREEHQAYISRVLEGTCTTSTTNNQYHAYQYQSSTSTRMTTTTTTTEEEEEALNNTTLTSSLWSLQQIRLQQQQRQREQKQLLEDKKKKEQSKDHVTTDRRSHNAPTRKDLHSPQHDKFSSSRDMSSSSAIKKTLSPAAANSSMQPSSPATTATSSRSSNSAAVPQEQPSQETEAPDTSIDIQEDMFWLGEEAEHHPHGPSLRTDQPPDGTFTLTTTSGGAGVGGGPSSSFTNRILSTKTHLRKSTTSKSKKTLISNLDRVLHEENAYNSRSATTTMHPQQLSITHPIMTTAPTGSQTADSNSRSYNSESPLLEESNNGATTTAADGGIEQQQLALDNSNTGTDWDVAWSRAGGSRAGIRGKNAKYQSTLTPPSSSSPVYADPSLSSGSSVASSINSMEFKKGGNDPAYAALAPAPAGEDAGRHEYMSVTSSDSFSHSSPAKGQIINPVMTRTSPPESPFRTTTTGASTRPARDAGGPIAATTQTTLDYERRQRRKSKKEVPLFPVSEDAPLVVGKDGFLLRRTGGDGGVRDIGHDESGKHVDWWAMSVVQGGTSPTAVISTRRPAIDGIFNIPHKDNNKINVTLYEDALGLEAVAEAGIDSQRQTSHSDSSGASPGCWKKRLQRTHQYGMCTALSMNSLTPDRNDDPCNNITRELLTRPASPTTANPLDYLDDWKRGPWANVRSSSSSSLSATPRSFLHHHQAAPLPSPTIVRKLRNCRKFLELESASETTTVPPVNDSSDDGNNFNDSASKMDASLVSANTRRSLEPFKMCVKCLLE